MLNFTKAQYEEIWDMIFQVTGYPPHHPKHESKSKKEEPQWEILAYKDINSASVYYLASVWSNSIYREGFKDYTGEFSKQNCFIIESVKRFPDNTVWSVGQVTGQGKIKKFQVIGENMLAEVYEMGYTFNIDLLTEAPKEEQVPIDKLLGSKEAFDTGYSMGQYDAKKYSDKKYTESELLLSRREAFKEARLAWASSIKQPFDGVYKHETVEDYINSLK